MTPKDVLFTINNGGGYKAASIKESTVFNGEIWPIRAFTWIDVCKTSDEDERCNVCDRPMTKGEKCCRIMGSIFVCETCSQQPLASLAVAKKFDRRDE